MSNHYIDVYEPNADPSGQSTGGPLIVDGKYEFSDLDELIVNHVSALTRRVEQLMDYEKFKPGPDNKLRKHHPHSLLAALPPVLTP